MTLRALLRGIIGVDPDILGGEIRGEESHRILAAPKLHTNIADRLRKTAMRLPPVERASGSVAPYLLTANQNLDSRWINGQPPPSHPPNIPSPVTIHPTPT